MFYATSCFTWYFIHTSLLYIYINWIYRCFINIYIFVELYLCIIKNIECFFKIQVYILPIYDRNISVEIRGNRPIITKFQSHISRQCMWSVFCLFQQLQEAEWTDQLQHWFIPIAVAIVAHRRAWTDTVQHLYSMQLLFFWYLSQIWLNK